MKSSTFLLKTLSRNTATAVGSALRRYLLGSVRGTAVTAVRIGGVPHRYADVPNAKETVAQIIANLKGLTIGGRVDRPVRLRASRDYPGAITARDLGPAGLLTFPQPDQPVATVVGNAAIPGLDLEMEIRSGAGHSLADANLPTGAEPGWLGIDAVFSPVRRVWLQADDDGTVRIGIECADAPAPGAALREASETLHADLAALFDTKEFSSSGGRFISHLLPRGRALTLGNLLEAALLFRDDDAMETTDVSFRIEEGGFLDHPHEERLILTVTVMRGATAPERLQAALSQAASWVQFAISVSEQPLPEGMPTALFAGAAIGEIRRFERERPFLSPEDPFAAHRASYDRFLVPDGSGRTLHRLLREAFTVETERGRCELVEVSLGEGPQVRGSGKGGATPDPLPLQVVVRITRPGLETVERRVHVADVPAMTERVTFMLNDRERVCVMQLAAAPGLLIGMKPRWTEPEVRVIPSHGPEARFDTDRRGNPRVRLGQGRPIDAGILLRAVGWSGEVGAADAPVPLSKRAAEMSVSEAQQAVGLAIDPRTEREPGGVFCEEMRHSLGYDLGALGRERLNARTGLSIDSPFLEVEDVLALVGILTRTVESGEGIDDPYHLKHQVVRAAGETMFEYARRGALAARRAITDLLENEGGPVEAMEEAVRTAFSEGFDDFLRRSALVRHLDDTNPLAALAEARRITLSGPGALDKKTAGIAPRYIHPSHYGRFCVIDTPEGDNIGLLRSLSLYARVDDEGRLLAPYRPMRDGKATDEIVYLRPEEEDDLVLAPGNVAVSADGELGTDHVLCRRGYAYVEAGAEEIDFVGISPHEIFGIPASMIPLAEYDDPNRSLMGANMSRQAVRIAAAETPIVASGYEEAFAAAARSAEPLISPGRNVLVAYLPWDGYNYEDAIVISDRLVREGWFTSVHERRFTAETAQAGETPVRFTCSIPGVETDICVHLDAGGLPRVGAHVSSGDVLIGKVRSGPGGADLDASLRVPDGCDGVVASVDHQIGRLGSDLPPGIGQRVEVIVLVNRPLKVGDKLANRHGAKGIVGKVVPEEDMPFLPDGTPVDMLCNPLGVPSRMNIGQLVEAHLGLAARKLGVRIVSPPLNGATSRNREELLREAELPEDGLLPLTDGRTGKTFTQRSTAGFVYWRKLKHMADDAFQARCTGSYDPASMQPVRGRGQKGGQKVGKMEIWALQSHGAAHNLREFLSIKADDAVGRTRFYDAIVEGIEEEAFRAPESANVLLRELRAAALDARYIAVGGEVNVDAPYEIGQVDTVSIAFASPERIRSWSHGEVTVAAGFDDDTGEPVGGGLFCPRIFGPLHADRCACGVMRGADRVGETCSKCGTPVLDWRAGYRRMGSIELATPVVHPWFRTLDPHPICALVGLDRRDLDAVVYRRLHVVLDPRNAALRRGQLLDDEAYRAAREAHGYDFRAAMGAEAIRELIESADVGEATKRIRDSATAETRGAVADALILLQALERHPDAYRRAILTVLPVLPSGLRPSMPVGDRGTAVSDLNELYERVIRCNNRLKSLQSLPTPDIMLRDEQRLLQEAVDALFGNGVRGMSLRGRQEMTLASLSDRLKGPKGRFVQGLAGKRVDYSGRAVIAPGAGLRLDECGVPAAMALELFRPFVVGGLVRGRHARSRKQAERMLDCGAGEAYRVLKDVVRDRVVLLVRAPALHKYNMLAFRPVLLDERTIRIHPNCNIGFNADFDGDQMTLHVPLSAAAHDEARRLLMAPRNLFATATGHIINEPSQEIVLGCWIMTSERRGTLGEGRSFENAAAARNAWKSGAVETQARIAVSVGGSKIETTVGRILFNDLLPPALRFVNEPVDKWRIRELFARCFAECGENRTAELADAVKDFGFRNATLWGTSVRHMPPAQAREQVFAEADAKIAELRRRRDRGEIDEEKRYLATIDLWSEAQDRLRAEVMRELDAQDDRFLPVAMMVRSAARGSHQQMLGLYGMGGLVTDMFGHVIEFPVRGSIMNGLDQIEYFLKSNGARAGLVMTTLRIASAGDLMRRIVEALEDVLVVEADCGTDDGIEMIAVDDDRNRVIQSLAQRALGRVAARDVCNECGAITVRAGEHLTKETLAALEAAGLDRVVVRSPIACRSEGGVCAACYGEDVGLMRPVEIGAAVGMTAALSLGEPLTQLTMRSFHIGHLYPFSKIARGKPEQDIKYSSAFPRLEEVFEMFEKRRAYGPALDGVDERPTPQEVLEMRGEKAARTYVVEELTRVYGESHVYLNSKHFEIASRRMFSFVEVIEPGDTPFVCGQRVERETFAAENAKTTRSGGVPAKANPLVLPITEVALRSGGFLAASASWQTVKILARAALLEETDPLKGMRENILLGRLIPVGGKLRAEG